jgi:hypothetical protein
MFINKQEEKELIISNFPNIKLSYENVIHKKVYKSDIILAIPEGIKCFAWFTYYLNEPVCFLLELFEKKQISSIQIINVSYKHKLSLGTIFYGTLFSHSNSKYFAVENIFWYKGNDISNSKWINKFETINTIMSEELKQVSYSNKFVIFGLPILSNDVNDILLKIKKLDYKIQSLHFMLFGNYNKHLFLDINDLTMDKSNYANANYANTNYIKNNTNTNNYTKTNNHIKSNNTINNNQTNYTKNNNQLVFHVKADLQNDIYHLYCYDNSQLVHYNTACVPNYDTSVMLNKLFRTIKENVNLDALEESDDEDEFQNENIDRFVDLNKNYKMLCRFNYKFKKWTPIKITNDLNVCQKKDINIF